MRTFILLVLILQCGCIPLHRETHRHVERGIPLSEAMEASASGEHEPLHDSSSRSRVPDSYDVAVSPRPSGSGGGGGGDFELVTYDDRDFTWQVLFDTAYSKPFNGSIDSLTRFTLTPFSFEDEHNYGGVFIAGAIVTLVPGSLPDRAVKNPWWFEAGFTYRYYLIDSHHLCSPYVTGSASFQALLWSYQNSVTLDGETVSGDALAGGGGYAGFGVVVERNKRLNVFGEIGIGGTVFYGTTREGFNNDVFANFAYFSVKAGLSLKF